MLRFLITSVIFSLIPYFTSSCSSTGKDQADDGINPDEDLAGLESEGKDSESGEGGDLSANNSVFTYSLFNNSLTSKTVDTRKARREASRLAKSIDKKSADATRQLTNLLSLNRFSGNNLSEIFGLAKQIATLELQKDIRRQIPEQAKLELALAAIQAKELSMAEFWLSEIGSTRSKRMKAAELTARGIIAKIDNRLPEAVDFWYQAINNFPAYEPARLNLGFTALQFGDYTTAKKMLADIQEDWFAASGLMQAERLANNVSETDRLCEQLVAKMKNYKPILFSCALNTYQGKGDLQKAKQEIETLMKVEGGPSSVDERALKVIERIQSEINSAAPKEKAPEPQLEQNQKTEDK